MIIVVIIVMVGIGLCGGSLHHGRSAASGKGQQSGTGQK
jgi:hypothetical protein